MKNIETFLSLLKDNSVISDEAISEILYKECDYKKGSELPTVDNTWQSFSPGTKWGETRDTHCWFYFKAVVPVPAKGNDIYISVKTDKTGWDAENPQFIAYLNGECRQGLDLNHTEIFVEGGKEYEVYLYAYSGTPSPSGDNGKFASSLFVSLIEKNSDCEGLFYDVSVPFGITEYLDTDDVDYALLQNICVKTAEKVNFDAEGEVFYSSVKNARRFIKEQLYANQSHSDTPKIACIGHTHIDIAWMWTVAQAREKVQRSFATQIALLKRNDDFRFTSSQAYLYNAVKEECPELYEEIKKMVSLGKWEAEGAAWVECDMNVPSGESIVRQLYYGKKFFKEEFGVDCKVMWLPDVFGYSAALPQILKKSGVDKFVTSKLSWNDTNRMPDDMFMWKGIDGSEVLTHFISTTPKRRGKPVINGTGYVSQALPSEVAGTYERFQPKTIADELICCYGFGDGGGGVTQAMIERVRRMSFCLPGCPATEMKTVARAFSDMDKKLQGKTLPCWSGELYLEFHRGTYTTRANNKKYNRLCENLLRKAEWLSAADSVICGKEYPSETFERLWKSVLLNQFHDILPGSSIKEVYDVTDEEYKQIVDELQGMILAAEKDISPLTKEGEKVVFNSTSWRSNGKINGINAENVPSFGYKKVDCEKAVSGVKIYERTIENQFYKIVFNESGQILSFIYKPQNREVVKSGTKANVLTAFRDIPREYEAWNIDADYIDDATEISEVVDFKNVEENGKKGFKFVLKYGSSEITQSVLADDGKRIDFKTQVKWREKQVLLKALFPVDVCSDHAVYDIQFGTVKRTTHNNTSWDAAQFEVPAQRFAYIAEEDFAFALLNDCKYGYSSKDNVLGLSLLRGTNYPCRNADAGDHTFTYSIMAESENYAESILKEAELLNLPFEAVDGSRFGANDEYSFVSISESNVEIDSVKITDDKKFVAVRLHEAVGKRTECRLNLGFTLSKAYFADLMENPVRQAETDGNCVEFFVKPFEIVTILLEKTR